MHASFGNCATARELSRGGAKIEHLESSERVHFAGNVELPTLSGGHRQRYSEACHRFSGLEQTGGQKPCRCAVPSAANLRVPFRS
jgi:hypothetical protein